MLKRDFDRVLCSTWKFMPDREDRGGERGYMLPNCDISLWREAEIPCVYEKYAPDCMAYQGYMWYRKTFCYPRTEALVWLEFRGVNFRADVWLNGKAIGTHSGGYLPFRFEISEYLQEGENLLCVRVDGRRHAGMLPPGPFWRCHGGILRDVLLYSTPLCEADEVQVHEENGRMIVRTVVRNHSCQERDVSVVHSVDGRAVRLGATKRIAGRETAVYTFSFDSEGLECWSPSNPMLYSLRTEVICGEDKDVSTTSFGVRTLQTKDGKILLNGKPLFLRGFNRHEDSPDQLHATDVACAERDFRMMKEMGANFVRMCHYPHSEEELEICDRIGLVVLDELPLCAPLVKVKGMDEEQTLANLKLTRKNAVCALKEMIRRDYNHPSVFFWSMSNEAEESYPEICQLNEYLLQNAKKLDSSRFVVHVSEGRHWNRSFDRLAQLFLLDDVICINSYAAIDRKNAIAVRRFWDAKLAEFSAAYPGKPVLVTEFGYPTEREQDGIKDEEEQASAIQRDLDGMGDRVAGWAVWHFTDHEWEITEDLEPYYGTHFSPYGVFRRDRTPKPAAALLKEYMKTHFQDK